MASERYLIAIATFRRPVQLRRLLDSLEVSIDDEAADIFVVDNDPDGSAEELVSKHSVGARYAHEPRPGIAEARNRGLEAFDDAYEAIIFVDDDEWVAPDWFQTITRFARERGCDVVTGPVKTNVPIEGPGATIDAGNFQRRIRLTGERLNAAATNNTLLRRSSWVSAGAPSFDPSFSLTGGSDTMLFSLLRSSGAEIVYCAEALVFEDVPEERSSKEWLRKRHIRNGIVDLRVRRKLNRRITPLILKSLIKIVIFGGTLILTRRDNPDYGERYRQLFVSLGVLRGAAGHRINEYARSPHS